MSVYAKCSLVIAYDSLMHSHIHMHQSLIVIFFSWISKLTQHIFESLLLNCKCHETNNTISFFLEVTAVVLPSEKVRFIPHDHLCLVVAVLAEDKIGCGKSCPISGLEVPPPPPSKCCEKSELLASLYLPHVLALINFYFCSAMCRGCCRLMN